MYVLSISMRLDDSLQDTILQSICISSFIASMIVALLQGELLVLVMMVLAGLSWLVVW
jgi:hypothetical protein